MHTNHLACVSLRVASGRQVNTASLALFPSLLPPGLLVPNVYACMYIRGGRRHESGEEVGGGGGEGRLLCVCVMEQLGGSGSTLPQQKFLIRCSQIASEALLGEELPIEYPPICIFFSSLPVCCSSPSFPFLILITLLLCCLFISLLLHPLFLSLLPSLFSSFHSLPPIIS